MSLTRPDACALSLGMSAETNILNPSVMQVADAVLPVLLLPEEAALILDEGLVSISIVSPSSGHACQQGAEGDGSSEEQGGKITIPHLPLANQHAGAAEGGLRTLMLRRSSERSQEWGLSTRELRATQSCEDGWSPDGGMNRKKRTREARGQALEANEGPSGNEGHGAAIREMADAGGDEASGGWQTLWRFPTTEVH